MKVVLGSDHAGFELKETLKKHFNDKNIEVVDVGTNNLESTDYPVYGRKVGETVVNNDVDFGVVICGTGIGISIAANKVDGVRAALVYDENTAKLAKEHNNANVLALGGRTTKPEDAIKIVDTYMEAKFEERHKNRVDML